MAVEFRLQHTEYWGYRWDVREWRLEPVGYRNLANISRGFISSAVVANAGWHWAIQREALVTSYQTILQLCFDHVRAVWVWGKECWDWDPTQWQLTAVLIFHIVNTVTSCSGCPWRSSLWSYSDCCTWALDYSRKQSGIKTSAVSESNLKIVPLPLSQSPPSNSHTWFMRLCDDCECDAFEC